MGPWTLKIGQMKLDIYRFIAGLFESHLDSRVDSVEVQPWSEVHNVLFTSPSVQSQVRCVGQGAGAVLFNIILFLDIHHREWRSTERCKSHFNIQIWKLVEKILDSHQNGCTISRKGFVMVSYQKLIWTLRPWMRTHVIREEYYENCDIFHLKCCVIMFKIYCVFMLKYGVLVFKTVFIL